MSSDPSSPLSPGASAAGAAVSPDAGRSAASSSGAGIAWCWVAGAVLALATWWPLVLGYGLIGGDIYTYFFPLKWWYAERLRHGELALWNPLIGNGAPALGESQTGVLYPFNLVLYRVLSVNAAYNASLIAHYVLAFGFTSLYLRRLGLGLSATLLGAIVFVYGWFPARSCLEWAIVTGAWLPLVLWGVESFLVTRQVRFFVATVAGLAMQLLAGHFHLAFITQLIVALYAPLRCVTLRLSASQSASRLAQLLLCGCLALGAAGVQLLPSWELKNRSQRGGDRFQAHDRNYGKLPMWYLAQTWTPWAYYPGYGTIPAWHTSIVLPWRAWGVIEQDFPDSRLGGEYTNRVEAHLYLGLLSLPLGGLGLVRVVRRPVVAIWLLLGSVSLVLASGWPTEALGSLPGFGYFTGAGRYGIGAQLAGALAAAFGLQWLVERSRWPMASSLCVACLLLATWIDLGWAAQAVQLGYSGRPVQYARAVPTPPIALRDHSPIARILQPTDRVLSKNQNSITLCGSAMWPVYLGIGPAEYYRDPTKLPDGFHWEGPITDDVLDWLRHCGVTHILATEDHPSWPVDLIWRGYDPMIHAMLGRDPRDPLWLYRLRGALGRAYWWPAESVEPLRAEEHIRPEDEHPIEHVVVRANQAQVRADLPTAAVVCLTALDFPGWEVFVDDKPAVRVPDSAYRLVRVGPGRHVITWRYRPSSLCWGGVLSLLSISLTVAAAIRLRHRA